MAWIFAGKICQMIKSFLEWQVLPGIGTRIGFLKGE
jgi:hypothetical protein